MKKIISLVFLALLTLIFAGGTLYYVSYKKPVATPLRMSESAPVRDCSVTDTGVIDALNIERSKIGLSPVSYSEYLDNLANTRATELQGTMDSHVGFRERFDVLDMNTFISISENLSEWDGCLTSSVRLNGFRYSQKHWDSLMNPTQDVVGVGFVDNVLVVILGDLR